MYKNLAYSTLGTQRYRVFFICNSLVQYQNENRLKSQPEALSAKRFHETAVLVGSLVFLISVLKRGSEAC